jgi:hypothetical protein
MSEQAIDIVIRAKDEATKVITKMNASLSDTSEVSKVAKKAVEDLR